jgi:uncharacterized heparinase superfamily protein
VIFLSVVMRIFSTMKIDIDESVTTSNNYLFAPVLTGADAISIPSFASSISAPTIGTYWRTLKHLRLSQLYYLLRNRVLGRNELSHWPEAHVRLRACQIPSAMGEWEPVLARRIIQTNDVQFVESAIPKSMQASWRAKEISRRQIFHANYCDFLNVDLTAPEESDLLRRAISIALSWRDQNPLGTEVGWGRFFLSLRIVNWLKFLARNAARAEEIGNGAQIDQVLASLRVQILSLESRLEKELLANHLFKNAKALVFAGALLEAPETNRWRVLGQRLLRQQIAEQILPDGGHIERSPMYHAWILDDLLDIQHLFESRPPLAPECALEVSRGAKSMARYLSQIVHPDGEIPLFNDSQFEVTRPTAQILADAGELCPLLSKSVEVKALSDTGYAVIRESVSKSVLIFDCGPLGPDYQPGHGHADILSYELSLHGQRVIVDTGVSSYELGPERHYERSTAAHNTVRVDEVEQAEIWAGFRVGRRPVVSPVHFGEIEGCQFVRGEHAGYKHLNVLHSRAIIRLTNNSWFFVDTLSGKGTHKIESFVHFHPAIQLLPYTGTQVSSPGTMVPHWVIEFHGKRYLFVVSGNAAINCTDAWYSPGFAVRLPQSVIHWSWEGMLPKTMVYAVVPEDAPPVKIACIADPRAIELNHIVFPLQ